jgi:hypothetical protein
MFVVLNSYVEKIQYLKSIIGKEKLSILSPTDRSFHITTSTELDRLTQRSPRPQFESHSLSAYFSSLFQYCLEERIHKVKCIFPLEDSFFSSSRFQVLLGKSYLQVTGAIIRHELALSVYQYPMEEEHFEMIIVPNLQLEYTKSKKPPSLSTIGLCAEPAKIEKRQLESVVQTAGTKKQKHSESRPLQSSYLICEPTMVETTMYPENSLGALYCQPSEKQLFGRVYGLNWEEEAVNSPRKKQRV